MSKLVHGLVAAAVAASALISIPAFAQQGGGYAPTYAAPQGPPQGYAPKRRDICGAPITGQAPAIYRHSLYIDIGGQ